MPLTTFCCPFLRCQPYQTIRPSLTALDLTSHGAKWEKCQGTFQSRITSI